MTGLYIHVPFCAKKCPYCDFYSENYSKKQVEAYIDAVCRNISRYGNNKNIFIDTVYFGGGTPSLLTPYQIEKIMTQCHESFKLAPDTEVTVECNPNTITLERMTGYLTAGINRISIGVQSLNDDELIFLGRKHDSKKAEKAVYIASEAGFKNISCDIMIALPNQTENNLAETINNLAELPVNHISSYILKAEENTPFYTSEIISKLPDDEKTADLYLAAVKLLEENNFMQYEISNFSKTGFQSRHNNKYWNCEEYIGIGPAAHSYFNGKRYAVEINLEKFCNDEFQEEIITDPNPGEADEVIMLALRLKQGISLKEFPVKNNNIIKSLIKANYVRIEKDRLFLTPNGFIVSNAVIGKVLEAVL